MAPEEEREEVEESEEVDELDNGGFGFVRTVVDWLQALRSPRERVTDDAARNFFMEEWG